MIILGPPKLPPPPVQSDHRISTNTEHWRQMQSASSRGSEGPSNCKTCRFQNVSDGQNCFIWKQHHDDSQLRNCFLQLVSRKFKLSRILTLFGFHETITPIRNWSANQTESGAVRARGFLLCLRTALAAPALWSWAWKPSCSLEHKEWGEKKGIKQDMTSDRWSRCEPPGVKKGNAKRKKNKWWVLYQLQQTVSWLSASWVKSHTPFEMYVNFTGSSCCEWGLVLAYEWKSSKFSDI